MFSGTSVGRVMGITHPANSEGLRTPWFRMAVPRHLPSSFDGHEVLAIAGEQPFTLLGDLPMRSATVQRSDVLRGGPVQQLSIGPSKNMPLSQAAKVLGSSWLVTCYVYKLLSGPAVQLQVNGTSGLSGIGDLSSTDWEMLINISKFDFAGEGRITAYHQAQGKSVLLIAAIAMRSFEKLQ